MSVFGRYQLLGRLGAGGMAEVFVARCGELAGMQSLLAVKRILPHLADDEGFVSLFRREAQISLRLRHRAIARVFEVGRVGDSWFLAMELVAGESLAHLLRAEAEAGVAVDPRLVAWVGAEIASALHHAHALTDGISPLEVIHRDVSPQNLLLGFDGAAKLIDFGVARCARLSDATRTGTGTVRGKLAYASPEQLTARSLDGRSDLFSLAIVLHEWLTGASLFGRESDAATVQAVQSGLVPPLGRAPRLGAVLARALERAPERRYPDGESLAEALLDAVGGRPASPERLVADHLAALFPDRKRRWQAITVGRQVDGDRAPTAMAMDPSLSMPGGTLRGTPASAPLALPVSQSRILVGRRARRRLALALAAVAGLASLLTHWVRRDHGTAFHAVTPALSKALAPAVLVPVSSPVPITVAAAAPVGDGGPRVAAHVSRRHVRRAALAAALAGPSASTSTTTTSSSALRPSPARRAVVDELEPSPYATKE
jgi:hypothetical protein